MQGNMGFVFIALRILRRVIDMVLGFLGEHEKLEKEVEANHKNKGL